MKSTLLIVAIALSSLLLFAQHNSQNSNGDQEVTGTVSCPACAPNGAQKLDLVCARTCLDKKGPTTASSNSGSTTHPGTTNNSDPGTRPSNASEVPNPVADPTDTKPVSPNKPTDTSVNLIIIEDGDHRTVAVNNPEVLKRYVAHRIAVTGYWIDKAHFHVTSVRIL
ncbi:MAG TPA: hypothetical protein VF753_09270 [Terriglobales bacterium]